MNLGEKETFFSKAGALKRESVLEFPALCSVPGVAVIEQSLFL